MQTLEVVHEGGVVGLVPCLLDFVRTFYLFFLLYFGLYLKIIPTVPHFGIPDGTDYTGLSLTLPLSFSLLCTSLSLTTIAALYVRTQSRRLGASDVFGECTLWLSFGSVKLGRFYYYYYYYYYYTIV